MNDTLYSRIIFAICGFALIASSADAAPYKVRKNATPFVPGEVLVKFKPVASSQARTNSISSLGGAVRANLNRDLVQVRLAPSQKVDAAVAVLSDSPDVEYAQPNYIYHALAVPNDPSYAQQWAFNNTAQTVASPVYATNNPGVSGNDMNMQLAWDHITDCSSVVVAVLDSGVNYTQQDLAANMWNGNANHGWNYTSEGNANDPMDLHGHGTHVAGIIGAAGNDGVGATGVCWNASIMAVRVLDSTGSGTTSSIISGINFAVTNGAKVINMSLGGGGTFDPAYSNAITTAQNNDVVVVVAAGNDTLNNDAAGQATYPCNFTHSNLICVAALDQAYATADFTNWGSTSVDVGAPGTNILSTWAGTNASITDTMDGTTLSWWVSTAGTGPGFGYGTATPSAPPYTVGTYNSLNFPNSASWYTAYAPTNTDARIWTVLNLSTFDAVTLDVFGAAHVASDGGVGGAGMAYRAAGTDPFAGTPTYFADTPFSPSADPTFSYLPTLSLSGCNKSATCAVGFRVKTGSTTTNLGMSIIEFTINTLTIDAVSYKLENGTSMATPAVAGLATMLRAFNPQYTAADVVANIKNSGRTTGSLAGITTTGRAVDAMKALSYISRPTGLTATVQ
jgi:subtilisin family serine protease